MDNLKPTFFRPYFSFFAFKFWPLKNYEAIVLWPFIFFKNKLEMTSPNILRHELIHLDQMRRHTVLGFYLLYVWQYFRGLVKYKNHQKAYLEIAFEKEAYEKQADKTIDVYSIYSRS